MAEMTKTRRNIIILIIAACIFGAFSLLVVLLTHLENEKTAEQQTPGSVSVELGEEEEKKWPILKRLPVKNTLYTIGYTIKDNRLKIFVDSTDTNIETALKKLASFTDKPLSSYDIEIKNPKNPFEGNFVENSAIDPVEFLKSGYQNVDFNIVNVAQNGEEYVVKITTGKEEFYNLIHYTTVLKKSDNGLELASEPKLSILLDQ